MLGAENMYFSSSSRHNCRSVAASDRENLRASARLHRLCGLAMKTGAHIAEEQTRVFSGDLSPACINICRCLSPASYLCNAPIHLRRRRRVVCRALFHPSRQSRRPSPSRPVSGPLAFARTDVMATLHHSNNSADSALAMPVAFPLPCPSAAPHASSSLPLSSGPSSS